MLYDEESLFSKTLKIQSFPFNLIVDRSRVIRTIHASVLLPADYDYLFEVARNTVTLQ